MLCALGDLFDDVVVWLEAPVERGTDTPARVFHRRGGSAANVAALAAAAGHPARFVGQAGADATGDRVVAELAADGVEVLVQRVGRTGTVVVVVEPGGERTMLTDRGDAALLADVVPAWLAGIGALHLTAYSLTAEPSATSTIRAAAVAARAGTIVSIDASSVRVLEQLGPARFLDLVATMAPTVLLANGDEAAALGLPGSAPRQVGCVVVKRGPQPALVTTRAGTTEVPVPPLAQVTDTTGAGDAFAAGFVLALLGGSEAIEAARAGHHLAAAVLRQPGATLDRELLG